MKRWIALAGLLAAACAGYGPTKEPPPKPFTATRWQLIMDIPPPGELPYVRFGDGRMEGFGGCSRFAARYEQDAVGARAIAIRRIEVDRRLCDPAVRAAESRMLDVLQAVSSYSVTADILTMSGSGGTLRFRAVDAPAAASGPPTAAPRAAGVALANTRWRGDVPGASEGNTPWLEFVDGRFSGYTGCNMVSGTWRMENGELRVGGVATTKRACIGPGGEIERRVLTTLAGQLRMEGGRLVATAPGGEHFEFVEVR
jgi:heat shock protein HslJ